MLTNRYKQTEDDENGHVRKRPDRYIGLRNILNAIFMLGALAGVLIYYVWDSQVGTIIILVSMLFKIVECVFRLMR